MTCIANGSDLHTKKKNKIKVFYFIFYGGDRRSTFGFRVFILLLFLTIFNHYSTEKYII